MQHSKHPKYYSLNSHFPYQVATGKNKGAPKPPAPKPKAGAKPAAGPSPSHELTKFITKNVQ